MFKLLNKNQNTNNSNKKDIIDKAYALNENFSHMAIIQKLLKTIKPKNYLEIGVQAGYSITMAKSIKRVIGVDPLNALEFNLPKNIKMFFMTSDDFFKKKNIEWILKGKIEMAFIDGMHLFDYVIRDFINVEKHCKKNSIVILHYTIPLNEHSSQRTLVEGAWTGDVYKAVMILRKYRPDLKIFNFLTGGIGTCVIKNLDPKNKILKCNYDKIINEFMDMPYSCIENDMDEKLGIIRPKSQDKEKEFLEIMNL